MLKQFGITTLEMLLSLTIISSVSAFTVAMSEEVEEVAAQYQAETLDVKAMRARIQSARPDRK